MTQQFDNIVQAIQTELDQGKTQEQLAAEFGVTQPTISAIVRGYRNIGGRVLASILAARPEWTALLNSQPQETPA